MGLLFWMLAGLAACVVYEVCVQVIDKVSAMNAAKEAMASDELKKLVKAKIKEKSSNTIKLSMLDENSDEICEVKITGQEVADDMRCGDVIYV